MIETLISWQVQKRKYRNQDEENTIKLGLHVSRSWRHLLSGNEAKSKAWARTTGTANLSTSIPAAHTEDAAVFTTFPGSGTL